MCVIAVWILLNLHVAKGKTRGVPRTLLARALLTSMQRDVDDEHCGDGDAPCAAPRMAQVLNAV